ncbi:Sulfate/thiosulfate import ATP-binding protein CysA [subsurface metagenome]
MIEIKDLCAELGKFSLKNISFDVQDEEYFILVGPTGSGKTMFMESIAGLKPTTGGQVIINSRDVTSLNIAERNVGFAFQDYMLYRHLSVRDNISFGLQWRTKTRQEIDEAVDRIVELLDISHLLNQSPWTLSGGESQRIALARALAIKPDLLLLDEPLSAVDPDLRETWGEKLKEIHNRLKLTTLHITHDFEESITLGDRIAVIGGGRIAQIGTPDQIYRHPNSEFVARFVRTRNIFEGEVSDSSEEQGVFCVEGVRLAVVTTQRGRLHASIRPEDIIISREPLHSNTLNSLQGVITRIVDRGTLVSLNIDVPPQFNCLILHRSLEEMGLEEKQQVFISFEASAVNIFEAFENVHSL